MKKILSVFLSFVVAFTSFFPLVFKPVPAQAADYAAQLRNKGFPESYIKDLTELHNKYPNWIFEPLQTGIKFSTAVDGERSRHANQLIEKSSIYDKSFFCKCSSCYKNGGYVIQEASNWVSASEKAVEYYLDPRNWLNEKHIFQFESTKYDGTQSKAGVEAILDGTWMEDSLIKYKTTSGKDKTYNSETKYSDAIMKAANDSGMNAYYLASKIRQENGGATASASAVKGTVSPFQGIYNYYNIGAYTGASDGLAWAAGFLKASKNTPIYASYDSKTGKPSKNIGTLRAGQYMTWRANKDDYYYVRLYAETNGYTEGRSGYVLKKDCRTTYIGDTATGWGRPWTNPYKSIYYGSKYIAKSFVTQPSGYLQKFNVSPSSDYLYTHEYMANVAAPSSESLTTYNAYKKANILGITKKFSIPVFEDMPEDEPEIPVTIGQVKNLKVTSYTSNSVNLSWSKAANADSYLVQVYRGGKWTNYSETSSANKNVTGLANCAYYKFRVKAKGKSGGKTINGPYSSEVKQITRAVKPTLSASSTNTTVTLKWNKNSRASGYRVYKYDASSKKFKFYKDLSGSDKTSLKITGLKGNTKYQFRVLAYRNMGSKKICGYQSSTRTIYTKNKMVTLNSAVSSKKKRITVKWNKVSAVSGYQVMWSTTSNFKKNFLSKYVKGSSKTSITLNTYRSKHPYYVRVRAYKTVKGKKQYCSWSRTIKVNVK